MLSLHLMSQPTHALAAKAPTEVAAKFFKTSTSTLGLYVLIFLLVLKTPYNFT